jgi:YVTN family beta-propeller protein
LFLKIRISTESAYSFDFQLLTMTKHKLLLTLTLFVLFAGLNAQTPVLKLSHTFQIAGTGGWDYLAVSPVKNWLYVSHGSQVNIIDKTTGDSVGILENTTGVHGIAFDVANKKGFTSNGRLNTVTVFDLNSNAVLAQIAVGQNPDAIMYEPFTKRIITCNGRSDNLSIIDPVNNQLVDSVALTGKPETAVADDKGTLYVNIEDKNEITVIDLNKLKVLHHWSITPGEGPTGLAFDINSKKLFAGCDKLLMVIDATNGKIAQQIIIGDGCDGVAFDPALKNIYTSNGEGTISMIHENAPGKYSLIKNITTKKGARTIALDIATHTVYLPTAEFEPLGNGEKGRPKIKPGTFQVLVFNL